MPQRNVPIGNLMMNEEDGNPSWRSFLIDLDLAIREQRERPSGARGKTGTRAFMAIGVLYDEKHSFRHDLESFFWVLFWICIHYHGPGKEGRVTEVDCWSCESTTKLAKLKLGTVWDEDISIDPARENFTPYYEPLIPWVNTLRKVVFSNGGIQKKDDSRLYSQMKEILLDARKDPKVLDEQTS